jgi:two-component system, chemotaxis family, protein-glutamate methylesterase/glutaminase
VKTQPAGESLEIENQIALEGNALKGGVMKLGPISPNTCPECHGVLVRIQQGAIIRYRCHTGHSFSLKTLLADVDQAIDNTLWNAVRAMEERILLLQEMRDNLVSDDKESDGHALEQAQEDVAEQVQKIREMLITNATFGYIPISESHRSPEQDGQVNRR